VVFLDILAPRQLISCLPERGLPGGAASADQAMPPSRLSLVLLQLCERVCCVLHSESVLLPSSRVPCHVRERGCCLGAGVLCVGCCRGAKGAAWVPGRVVSELGRDHSSCEPGAHGPQLRTAGGNCAGVHMARYTLVGTNCRGARIGHAMFRRVEAGVLGVHARCTGMQRN
jgi:hypothetical protein